MANSNQIDLILRAIFQGEEEFKRAQLAIARVLGATEQLGNEATKTGDKQEQSLKAAREKADELAKAFKQVRDAQKLLEENKGTKEEEQATELLEEEQKKLGKIIDANSKAQSDYSRKSINEIKELQGQLSKLVEKQRELQNLGNNRSRPQNNELTGFTGQIEELRARITALRAGSTELAQQSTQTNQAVGRLSDGLGQLNSFAPQSVQRLGAVSSQILNVAKSFGAGGAAVAGFIGITGGLTSALITQTEALAKNSRVASEIQKSTGASASFIGALSSVIKEYGGEIGNVQELLLQVGSVLNQAVAEPAGTTAQKIDKLGIAFRDVSGRARTAEQVIRDIDKAARETGLSTEQLAIVSTLFGEEASKQFLGRVGELEKLEEQLKKTGAIINDELIAKANEFNASGRLLNAQIEGLSNNLSGELLGALTAIKKVASETLENLDPDTINGFKAIIQDLGRAISALGETGVKGFALLATAVGDLATGVSAILNPFDTLKLLLTGTPALIDANTEANNKLIKSFTAGTVAIEDLNKKLAGLQLTQSLRLAQAEADAQVALENVERRRRQELITEQEAADEKLAIEKKLLQEKDIALEGERGAIIKFVDDQRALREKDFADQQAAENKLINDRKQKVEDFVNFKRDNEFRLQQLNTQTIETERELNSRNGEAQKSILRDKLASLQAEQKAIQDGLNLRSANAKIAETNDSRATANRIKAAEELAKFEKALSLEEVVTEQQVGPQLFALRKVFIDNKIKLNNSFRAQNAADKKAELEEESNLLAEKTKSIDKINKLESDAQKNLAELFKAGKLTQQELDEKSLTNKIGFEKQRIDVVKNTLSEVEKLEVKNVTTITALKKEAADKGTQVTADETKKRIDKAQSELTALKITIDTEQSLRSSAFETRKLQISQIKDLGLRAIQERKLEIDIANETILKSFEKIALEEKTLEVLKAQGATKEQLLAQEGKITIAIRESQNASEQARLADKKALDKKIEALGQVKGGEEAINERIANSANRADSAVGKLKGGLAVVGESFNFASLSTEELNDRILQLEGNIKFIREVAAIGDKDAFINPQLEVIDKLNEEIINRTQRAQLRAEEEKTRIRIQAQTEAAIPILKAFQDEKDQEVQIERQYNKNIKGLKKEAEDEEKTHQDNLGDIAKERREKELTEEKRNNEALYQDKLRLENQIASLQSKNEQDALAQDTANAIAGGDLRKQITEEEGNLKNAKDDKSRADIQKKIDDLKKQLGDLTKKDDTTKEAAGKRDKDNADAALQLTKDLESAKTDEEREAAKARFDSAIQANNDRYSAEIKFQNDLLLAQKTGDQAVIDEVTNNYKKQLGIINSEQARQNTAIQTNLEHQRQLRLAAEAQEQKDYNDKITKENKRNSDTITRINDQIAKEDKAYEKQRHDLETKTAETVANITKNLELTSGQIGDFIGKLAASFGLTTDKAKALADEIERIQKSTQKTQDQAGSASGSPGNAPATSPTNTPSNNNPPNSNPTSGVVGGSPSNTAGSQGTVGRGIVEQPNRDKSGNDKPGVSKGVPKTGQGSPGDSGDVSLPGSILLADAYRDICGKIFNKFNDILGGKNRRNYSREEVLKLNKLQNQIYVTNSMYIDGAGLGQVLFFNQGPNLYNFPNKDKNKEEFRGQVEFVVTTVEAQRKKEGIPGDKGNDGFGDRPKGEVPKDGGAGGGVPGDKGNDGFGDKPKPTIPTAPPPPPSGRNPTDAEKAFNAGRAQDAANKGGGDDEAFKEGDAILDPDSAIDPAARPSNRATTRPKTNTIITSTGGDKPPTNQPVPNINNSPTFAPTFAPTFQVIIQTKEQPTTANINQSLNALNTAFQDVSNQSAQAVMRTLTQEILNKIGQNFRG